MGVVKNKGFTLVELLVVVAVVGALAAVAIVVLNPAQFFREGRDGRRLTDLSTVQTALEAYYAENDSYPATGGVPFGAAWTPYLKTVPNDPNGSPATYEYCASGTPPLNYEVCTTMETTPLPPDCVSPVYGCGGNCCLTNPF